MTTMSAQRKPSSPASPQPLSQLGSSYLLISRSPREIWSLLSHTSQSLRARAGEGGTAPPELVPAHITSEKTATRCYINPCEWTKKCLCHPTWKSAWSEQSPDSCNSFKVPFMNPTQQQTLFFFFFFGLSGKTRQSPFPHR